MRSIAALLLLGTLALAGAAPAHADCAMPTPAIFPAGGALPPRPTLYRFALAWTAEPSLRIDGPDGPVTFTARDVSATDDVRVTELRIDAAGGPITLRAGDEAPRSYRIEAQPTAPRAPLVADRVAWVSDAWTCSHSTGLVIELRGPDVIALRARWTGGATAIVPANDTAFWTAMSGGEVDPAALRGFLGHPSCLGNLIPERLIGRRDFELEALSADGTSRPVALPRTHPPAAAAVASAPTAPPAVEAPPPAAPTPLSLSAPSSARRYGIAAVALAAFAAAAARAVIRLRRGRRFTPIR